MRTCTGGKISGARSDIRFRLGLPWLDLTWSHATASASAECREGYAANNALPENERLLTGSVSPPLGQTPG
jgi:hypothetical protein